MKPLLFRRVWHAFSFLSFLSTSCALCPACPVFPASFPLCLEHGVFYVLFLVVFFRPDSSKPSVLFFQSYKSCTFFRTQMNQPPWPPPPETGLLVFTIPSCPPPKASSCKRIRKNCVLCEAAPCNALRKSDRRSGWVHLHCLSVFLCFHLVNQYCWCIGHMWTDGTHST